MVGKSLRYVPNNHKHTSNVPLEIGILQLLCSQPLSKVMHHNVPVELDDSLQGCNTFHGVNVQNTRLGNEERSSVLGESRIELRILSEEEASVTTKRILGVGIEVHPLGIGSDFRCLFYHRNDICKYELASTKPPTESIDFSLFFAEGVNGVFEIHIPLGNFFLELHLPMRGKRHAKEAKEEDCKVQKIPLGIYIYDFCNHQAQRPKSPERSLCDAMEGASMIRGVGMRSSTPNHAQERESPSMVIQLPVCCIPSGVLT